MPLYLDRFRKKILAYPLQDVLSSILIFLFLFSMNTSYSLDARNIVEKLDFSKIRRELEQWDQSVRGFRVKHHFHLWSGPTRGTWRIDRFQNQYGVSVEDQGVQTKFYYSYHIQIFKKFGYFLGSGLGYWSSTHTNRSKEFSVRSIEQIPGALAGLVFNITPGMKIISGVHYGMDRIQNLHLVSDEKSQGIVVTARTMESFIGYEYYYSLKRSFSFAYMQRDINYTPPRESSGKSVDVRFSKRDIWYAMGINYHLL